MDKALNKKLHQLLQRLTRLTETWPEADNGHFIDKRLDRMLVWINMEDQEDYWAYSEEKYRRVGRAEASQTLKDEYATADGVFKWYFISSDEINDIIYLERLINRQKKLS